MRKTFGLLAAVWSVGFCDAQHIVDSKQLLEVAISKGGLTRITVENDGIEDIYAYPKEFADNIQHHKSGHVFVVSDDLDKPFFVTLITKRGEEMQEKTEQEKTTDLLKKFIQGEVPSGFYPIDSGDASRGKDPLEGVIENAFQNGTYRVLVFRVKNNSDEKLTLDNRLMWEEGDLVSAFDQADLLSNQSAKLVIIRKV